MILDNDLCKFEILNRKHLILNDDLTPKSVNLVSAVFFKRDQYYKNFGIYVKGLARTIRFIDNYNEEVEQNNKQNNKSNMENFYFLLFIDSNIRNDSKIMKIIERSENTVPILFKCPTYIEGEYHVDLFGTLVRFFPMFNFKNNPAKNVICIDIELNKEDTRKIKALMTHQPQGVSASGEIHKLIYNGEIPYIYAGTLMFNREKLDLKIIIDYIESAHLIKNTGKYGKRKTTFGYGIDEIFLNQYLLPIVKEYSIIIGYQISYFLYFSKPYIKSQKRAQTTKNMLKLILYDMYNPDLTIDDMIEFVDKSLFMQDLKREIKRQTNEPGPITSTSDGELVSDKSPITIETDEKSDKIISSYVGEFPIMTTESDEKSNEKEDKITDADVNDFSTVRKILQNLLGDLYNPSLSVDELITIVDKKTYDILEKNEVNNALAERFYYVIHDLCKNNKVWMEKDIMKLIDDNLRNIISAIVLFKIDPDNKEITDVTTYDAVYTNTII